MGAVDIVPPASQALAAFDRLYPRILALVEERFGLELNRRAHELDRRQREIIEDSARRLGDTLKAVYSFSLFEYLEKETSWLVSVLESRGLGREWVDGILEAWTIGIQGFVEPRETEELSRPLIRVRSLIPRLGKSSMPNDESPGEDVERYIGLVLRGRRREAAEYALAYLKTGTDPGEIADDLLLPALHHLGLLWERNRISSSEEHLATEITRYVIHRLFDGIPAKKSLPFSAYLACVPGEEHDIGIDLLANLLRSDGWSPVFIGRGAPHQDLVDGAASARPDVVILSVTLVSHLPAARALVLGLKAAMPGVRIVLGGAAALAARKGLEPLVSGVAEAFAEGRRMALSLVGQHA